MRDDQTRKSYKQIYLYVFEKIITIINEIEKIVAMITIKSSKHLIKSNVIHVMLRFQRDFGVIDVNAF